MSEIEPIKRRRAVYLLPNPFTTGGMFCGFYAIIAASQHKFEHACVAIFIAAVLDGLDGRVALLTNTQSEFGVQYDSLADLVSFGMAPALLIYHWSLIHMQLDGKPYGKLGWLIAFLYAACAALRLARFNSQVGVVDKRWFIGLASPAAAAVISSFVWVCFEAGWAGEAIRYGALGLTALVGLLMVSNVRYSSFKGSGKGPQADRVPVYVPMLLILAIIALVINQPNTLLFVFGLYALSGPMNWLLKKVGSSRQ